MALYGNKRSPVDGGSLSNLFEFITYTHSFAVAVIEEDTKLKISYAELNTRANKIARFLLKKIGRIPNKNPKSDPVIAICMPPSINFVSCVLASQKIGFAYVPLDVSFPSNRVTYILQEAKPVACITIGFPSALEGLENLLEEEEIALINLETLVEFHGSTNNFRNEENLKEDEVGLSISDIAVILYTSGSTGCPKGVRMSHRTIIDRILWHYKEYPIATNEVICFKAAITFIDSAIEIYTALLAGCRLLVVSKKTLQSVDKLIPVLNEYNVFRLTLVPTLLRSILLLLSKNSLLPKLHKLKLWMATGEPLQLDLIETFFDVFKSNKVLCNLYGTTEISDASCMQFSSIKDVRKFSNGHKVPIGVPLHNCNIYVLNELMEMVLNGGIGEIYFTGKNIALGYVKDDDKKAFIKSPFYKSDGFPTLYRTGDYGRISDSVLIYEGRADSQIKVRGHRIDLSEVETTLQSIEGVEKCSVLCYATGCPDQDIVGFYTSHNAEMSSDALKVKISLMLPIYMQPKLFQVDDLPILVNGKVDRIRLLEMYKQQTKANQMEREIDVSEALGNDQELARILLLTVLRCLGSAAPKVLSLNQNFFEIGGNSSNAVLTVTSLMDSGYSLEIVEFLEAQNFLELIPKLKKENIKEISVNENRKERKYIVKPLDDANTNDVMRLIAKSFAYKSEMEIQCGCTEDDFYDLFNQFWPTALKHGISFVVYRNGSDSVIAASINADYHDMPEFHISGPLNYIFAYLEELNATFIDDLPKGIGKIFYSLLTGTEESIKPAENVELMQFLEEMIITVAKENNYNVILTSNSTSVTQQIGEDILGYKTLSDNQINQWHACDGTKPFGQADDSHRVICATKFLKE